MKNVIFSCTLAVVIVAALIAPVNAQGVQPSTTPPSLDSLQQTITLAPGQYDNYLQLAAACKTTQSYEPSIIFLHKLIDDLSIRAPLALMKGTGVIETDWAEDLKRQGNTTEAITHLWNVYSLEKGRLDEGAGYTLNLLSNDYAILHDYPNAIKCAGNCRQIGLNIGNNLLVGEAYAEYAYVYMATGLYRRGIEYASKAIDTYTKLGDYKAVPVMCGIAALICKKQGKLDDEMRWINRGFEVSQNVDTPTLNRATMTLVKAYVERQEFDKAIPFLQSIIDSTRDAAESGTHADALDQLAQIYSDQERFDDALPLLREAVDDDSQAGIDDTPSRLRKLDLGRVLGHLRHTDEALDILNAAYAEAKNAGDITAQSVALSFIGSLYADSGDYDTAVRYQKQVIAAMPDSPTAQTFETAVLADYYRAAKNSADAERYYQMSIAAARREGDPVADITGSVAIAILQDDAGSVDDALDTITQPVILYPDVETSDTPRLFAALMYIEAQRGKLPLATIYGKQAVRAWQNQRRELRPLGKDTQDLAFTHAVGTYRLLTSILIKQNRLDEALQVYELMKRKEFEEYTNSKDANAWPIPLTPAEKSVFDDRQKLIVDIAAKEQTARDLREHKREADLGVDTFNVVDQAALARAEETAQESKATYSVFMKNLESNFDVRLATPANTQTGKAPARRAANLKPGTVALYTLVVDDGYYVVALSGHNYTWTYGKITNADLDKKIGVFREAIQDPTIDVSQPATDLYNVLVKPIEPFLKQEHATRLLWSLDGALRYCPMAALFDGQQYLIERYACEEFTIGKQAKSKAKASVDQALGLGVTKAHEGFEALPNVATELSGLGQGVNIMLDDQFTRSSMVAALKSRKYDTVHIASHFDFQPGDDTKSFLLLGDGDKFSLADMKSMPDLFGNVDMLTLSACQTAVGSTRSDGREIDGCAVIAQNDGANTVVASLWPIADASTPVLMHTFYQLRRDHPSMAKSEALREAQLALLTGASPVPAGPAISHVRGGSADSPSAEDDVANLPDFHADQAKPFAHPYYWAPFVLIGRWQ